MTPCNVLHAMSSLSFKLHQLSMLLVPELVFVVVVGTLNCPNEPDFVQKFLSIKSNDVVPMMLSMLTDPLP
jgi:hypothetical protein